MEQTIRVTKQGVTARSRRIAQAIDDLAWQQFRVLLEGQSTARKLEMLRDYYTAGDHVESPNEFKGINIDNCNICIRLDNYLKALARGGRLKSGISLQTALDAKFKLEIVR